MGHAVPANLDLFVASSDMGKIRCQIDRGSSSPLIGLPAGSFSTNSKHETVAPASTGRIFPTELISESSDRVLKAMMTATKGDAPLPIDSTTHFESQDIEELSDILGRLDNPRS